MHPRTPRPSIRPAGFDPSALVAPDTAVGVPPVNELLHRHRTAQLCVSLRGLVGVRLTDCVVAVPEHAAVLVPPGVEHSARLEKGAAALWFSIDPAPGQPFEVPAEPVRLALTPMAFEMLKRMAVYRGRPERVTQVARMADILLLELALAPRYKTDFARLPFDRALRRMSATLFEQPQLRLGNQEWADRLAISERTLSRVMRQQVGRSFKTWRMEMGAIAAMRHLMDGESVERVAELCGYRSTSSFIGPFTRVVGCTPGQYRLRLDPLA